MTTEQIQQQLLYFSLKYGVSISELMRRYEEEDEGFNVDYWDTASLCRTLTLEAHYE